MRLLLRWCDGLDSLRRILNRWLEKVHRRGVAAREGRVEVRFCHASVAIPWWLKEIGCRRTDSRRNALDWRRNRRRWLKVASFLLDDVFRSRWHGLEDICVTFACFGREEIWFRVDFCLRWRFVNLINRWWLEKAVSRRNIAVDLVDRRWREECRRCSADFRDVQIRFLSTGRLLFLERLHRRLALSLVEEEARSWWGLCRSSLERRLGRGRLEGRLTEVL